MLRLSESESALRFLHSPISVANIDFAVGRPDSIPISSGRPANQDLNMAWLFLVLAGIFEVVWASAMKESHGFSRLIPSVITITFMLLSFGLLAYAMKTLPLGTAYTIWVGIGAVGAFVVGITMFGEALNFIRLIAAGLIVTGVIMLKIAAK